MFSLAQTLNPTSIFSQGTPTPNESKTQKCDDTPPGGQPVLLSATPSGDNYVILTWSKAQEPVTGYVVAYGLSPNSPQYGNTDIGKDMTSYTISGLSGGSTYYFRVRAVNGCNNGPFSNELQASPTGALLKGAATGFQSGLLTFTPKKQASPSAEIQHGATPSTQEAQVKPVNNLPTDLRIIVAVILSTLVIGVVMGILVIKIFWKKY